MKFYREHLKGIISGKFDAKYFGGEYSLAYSLFLPFSSEKKLTLDVLSDWCLQW